MLEKEQVQFRLKEDPSAEGRLTPLYLLKVQRITKMLRRLFERRVELRGRQQSDNYRQTQEGKYTLEE